MISASVQARISLSRTKQFALWLLAFAIITVIWVGGELWPWAVKAPKELSWRIESLGSCTSVRYCVTGFMKWLVGDESYVFPWTFKEFTRTIAAGIEIPYQFIKSLLAAGFTIPLGKGESWQTPPLSWLGITIVMTWIAYRLKDWTLALMVFLCISYITIFGHWESATITLSSIAVAVPIGVAFGISVGILGYRYPSFERAITPILDLMQTVPIFAYLVPVLFLFGFGPVSAITATVVYATPPMVRITMLALQTVPTDIKEFGKMVGCTKRQMTWRVLIPSAKPGLMVGVNQVIMLSLNMVIIASMIGAGGLGFDVLASLRRQAIGEGLEAGIAITLIAIVVDRLTQAWAAQAPELHSESNSVLSGRTKFLLIVFTVLAITTTVGFALPIFAQWPEVWEFTTGQFWNDLVKWININFFDQLEAIKIFILLNILKPLKLFLLELPWPGALILLGLAGYQLGGPKLALLVVSLASFILITGQWTKAMITVYLCGISVVFASIIGMTIGIVASGSTRLKKAVLIFIDTLQTLPSFVYLLPVVMLFRVGDFSAMVAVVLYALPPAVRYTIYGIEQISASLIEAAKTSGCTRIQTLTKVQIRLAWPEIMLGINQTVMFALSMLVITALVGTRDLGQEVYIALTKADTGRGLVAGLSVAFIAIITDRLISAAARRRKQALGMG